ncbi:MAG: tetratricopeptide repeat protein [Cyanothece sp. SIO1E1]|nr:tetratricopeptide repeat protein [Cyanothece sp. SIO1E1]
MTTLTEALQLAVQYQQANRWPQAQAVYHKILEQQPHQPDALYGLGVIAQQLGAPQKAEQFLSAALHIQPNLAQAWFSLGNLRQAQTQFSQATAAYQRALAIQPKWVAVHNNLGYALQKQGRWHEAIACYQQALVIQPDCTEADVNLGNALFAQGQLSNAKRVDYAALNTKLGFARKKAGDLQTAITYYQQAIALQPDLAIAHYNLGVVLQEQGQLAEAIACYQHVVKLDPSDAGIYHQWATNKLSRLNPGNTLTSAAEPQAKLRVAFVNQYCDTVLPPFQNSVGACTYGIIRPLAEGCNVITYGIKRSEKLESNYYAQGVHYRFLSPLPLDRWLFKHFRKYQKFIKFFNRGMAPPPSFSRWVFPLYGRAVAKDLVLQQCNVIHFQHTSQYIPMVRALNPTAKIVLTLHSELFTQHHPATFERRLRQVDFVTCVSDCITEKTRQNFPQIADRCQTIYNGIETGEFAREPDYKQARQRPIKRLLYAGAVSPQKGVHTLLDAFQIVVQTYPDVQLDIVGPQGTVPVEETFPIDDPALVTSLKPFYAVNYMTYLKSQLTPDIAAKVSFPGMIARSKLIDRFFDADIFVFPPVWDEGFGIPPVEAMAAGTPVVATRSGAIVETVEHGKTGFLVAKNDAPALAAAILQLLEQDDLRVSMGQAARHRALTHFTWEQAADTTLQLYQALCQHQERT